MSNLVTLQAFCLAGSYANARQKMQDTKMSKKSYLDSLFKTYGDFEVASLYYESKNVYNKFSKWFSYSSIRQLRKKGVKRNEVIEAINNRTIFNIEIVLDLDDKTKFSELMKRLNQDNLNYYAFQSGNKGYHIHLYFPELKKYNSDQRKIIKKNIIERYECDQIKSSNRCMIALEHFPHFKTNRPKQLLQYKKGMNLLSPQMLKAVRE